MIALSCQLPYTKCGFRFGVRPCSRRMGTSAIVCRMWPSCRSVNLSGIRSKAASRADSRPVCHCHATTWRTANLASDAYPADPTGDGDHSLAHSLAHSHAYIAADSAADTGRHLASNLRAANLAYAAIRCHVSTTERADLACAWPTACYYNKADAAKITCQATSPRRESCALSIGMVLPAIHSASITRSKLSNTISKRVSRIT
jgi:hypothetical protein